MKSTFLILVTVLFILYENIEAIPKFRVKRVSDQRLAELETLVALSKMSGKLVTVPLGLGKVDPKYIGRKRRSQSRLLDSLFNQSSEEDTGDPVELDLDSLYAYKNHQR